VITITPVAAAPLPLQGAPLADRQSQMLGGHWVSSGCEKTVVVLPAVSWAIGG
jgi:hypothetical protein